MTLSITFTLFTFRTNFGQCETKRLFPFKLQNLYDSSDSLIYHLTSQLLTNVTSATTCNSLKTNTFRYFEYDRNVYLKVDLHLQDSKLSSMTFVTNCKIKKKLFQCARKYSILQIIYIKFSEGFLCDALIPSSSKYLFVSMSIINHVILQVLWHHLLLYIMAILRSFLQILIRR